MVDSGTHCMIVKDLHVQLGMYSTDMYSICTVQYMYSIELYGCMKNNTLTLNRTLKKSWMFRT